MWTTLLFILALPYNEANNPRPWSEVKRDGAVKVFARESVTLPDADELRAEAIMPFPIEKIWKVLVDVGEYTKFMPYALEARVLKKISPTEQIEYHLREPPIISRRDYVIRVRFDVAQNVRQLAWELTDDHAPPLPPNTVRMKYLHGQWTLRKVSSNSTWVIYQNLADGGGSVPNIAVRYANRTGLPDIMHAVHDRVAAQ